MRSSRRRAALRPVRPSRRPRSLAGPGRLWEFRAYLVEAGESLVGNLHLQPAPELIKGQVGPDRSVIGLAGGRGCWAASTATATWCRKSSPSCFRSYAVSRPNTSPSAPVGSGVRRPQQTDLVKAGSHTLVAPQCLSCRYGHTLIVACSSTFPDLWLRSMSTRARGGAGARENLYCPHAPLRPRQPSPAPITLRGPAVLLGGEACLKRREVRRSTVGATVMLGVRNAVVVDRSPDGTRGSRLRGEPAR